MEKTIRFEIKERIAVLSESGDISKELNKVSYNGQPAKYDLRSWNRTNGAEQPYKGLTLTETEARTLKNALNGIAGL